MTKEDVIRVAREAGTPYVNRHFQGQTSYGFTEESLLRFAALVAAAKQEECAKVCEDMATEIHNEGITSTALGFMVQDYQECADAIRALP